MYDYFAYGLVIRSVVPLPELVPAAHPPGVESGDVVLRLGPVPSRPTQLDATGVGFRADRDEACHVHDKVGAFLVRGGREIVVEPAPGVEDRVLRLSILGPALGLVLHQRGLLVLHASVVGRDGAALAVIGSNGWGKSTIAAALHARGYALVSDDLAAIRLDADGPTVLAGHPQVKLWPEAATLLGQAPDALPLLHPAFDKRGWRPVEGFSTEPRRLAALFVVAPGAEPAVEAIAPREACLELLTHWYGQRFGGGLLRPGDAAGHLRQCAALAGSVPMHRLRRSGGSATLLHLAGLVDEHFGRLATAESSDVR
jgi:hypothetical protein